MCNNNCCMCCQCNNTHDEDNPQEITYTSVCDSDACKNKKCCNCCCQDGVCEDDAKVLVYGLSEQIEERCEEVHKIVENVQCEIENINNKNEEQDDKLDDHEERITTLEYNESLDFNRVVYVPRDESQDHKAYIEFYHNDNYMGRISAEPFLKDGILDRVDLESDGHTLHFVWNTDAGKLDSHVDLNRLVQPLAQELQTEITNRINADTTINTNITNLKNSVVGYNPELGYDGTAVTVGQVDDKQFKVHMATFPELVLTVENSTNNRIAVTTNKGNTSYVNIANNTYETIQHAQDTYETIANANNHLKNASFNDSTRKMTFTKQDNTTFDVTIPDANDNNYVSNATVSDHTLTLTRQGLSDLTVLLPDNDHYITGGSVSDNTLKLTRNGGLSNITIQLPSWVTTDNDHYPTAASVDSNRVLHLTGANFTEVTAQLPADNDHYPTSASLNGNTLTISGNTGFNPISVDLSGITGTTNVTYGGNTVTIQQAITSIENRLNALEGLWEINPSDSTQLVAKNSRSAKAAGFYDSTVN